MACIAVDAVVDVSADAIMSRVGCGSSMASGAAKDGVIRRIGVARSADSICVTVIEREERMVAGRKRSWKPCRRCVARGAGGRPASRYVIWICSSCEIGLVARVAISGSAREDIIDVALIACDGNVRAGQREWRVVVVERSAGPGGGCVACFAGGGESCSSVSRIRCSVPISLVTSVASGGKSRVVVVGVAGGAGHSGVCACERECGVVVIER